MLYGGKRMRLIDADKLWKDITTNIEECADILEIIEKQPTIEAEPVRHGKWLSSPTGWIYCSVCHREPPGETNQRSEYCPNCGAKMDE